MTGKKKVFIAFAKEDETSRTLFDGHRLLVHSPHEHTGRPEKDHYAKERKTRVGIRAGGSDEALALISSSTPKATGQLGEIRYAIDEGKALPRIRLGRTYRTKPAELGSARCVAWTWGTTATFIER